MDSPFSLANKVAIVSGGGRGIGRMTAIWLARAGANVVVTARTAEEIKATAAEIQAGGGKAIAVQTDAQINEQAIRMVDRALEEFGHVDVLVNNVGGASFISASALTEDEWNQTIDKNLKTCFLCSKAVSEAMMRQGKGSIINIASTEALRPAPFNAAYGAAKAGVINLSKNLAMEWAANHIRVNVITPGFLDKPGLADILSQYPDLHRSFDRIPLQRAARSEDIAAAVVYLASDASDYVTGQMFAVDGGLTTLLP